ncbi:MAG TPA: hypothetical protein VK963_00930 [Candidatus Saccharimonadales bacterium]|nr:hypothetical protein [Candidatus Saccharimonadales bacterium]
MGTVTNVIDILKNNFGTDFFKAYFDGDPILIGKSSLPAIAVEKQASSYELGPTQFDRVTERLIIKLILNKQDDYGASDTANTTEKKLQTLVEGRDNSGMLLQQSVIGALRTHFSAVSDLTLDQDISVEYGVVPRPEDTITAEAHITIAVQSLQQVPNRI